MEYVLIFTDRARAEFASAVKEDLKSKLSDAIIIIIDDMDLHANPMLDLIENLTNIKVNKERREAVKVERKLNKNVDELPTFTWEFKEEEDSYRMMRRYFQKFCPSIVITIGYGAYLEAIATRDSLGVKTKVVSMIDDYTLNKALVSPYLDGYVVENLPLKKMLMASGVDAGKIAITPLAIENKYFDEEQKKGNVNLIVNNYKPTFLYVAKSESTDHKKTFNVLKEYDGKYNVIIYCGYNRESYKTALKLGLNAFNEGISLPMLYDKSDVVLTPGSSYDISVGRALGKVVAISQSDVEMERRNRVYLSIVVKDCSTPQALETFLETYKKDDYNSLALRSKVSVRADVYGALKKLGC